MPQGALAISSEPYQGGSTKLNLPVSTVVVVKASAGRVMQVNVNGTATGSFTVYDSATAAGTAATNAVYTSSSALTEGTIIPIDFPVSTGITISVGAGAPLAVSYL